MNALHRTYFKRDHGISLWCAVSIKPRNRFVPRQLSFIFEKKNNADAVLVRKPDISSEQRNQCTAGF